MCNEKSSRVWLRGGDNATARESCVVNGGGGWQGGDLRHAGTQLDANEKNPIKDRQRIQDEEQMNNGVRVLSR